MLSKLTSSLLTLVLIAHATRTQYKLSLADFTTLSEAPYLNLGLTLDEIAAKVQLDVYMGVYLELGSSAVCGAGLGIGCGVLLWFRGYLGPAPGPGEFPRFRTCWWR